MKAEVRDRSVLSALKPLEVASYLRATGWTQHDTFDTKGSLWLLNGREDHDITLPLRSDLGDYAIRMGELLHTLAEVECRSELEVLRDIMTTTADLVRVRVPSQSGETGTLPLEQAVTFVTRSRDMMLSAACAALEKRAFFAKRKPQRAMDYLRDVRMGQTEYGSYVLSILSPVAPRLKSGQDELFATEPYERQVIETLVTGLSALNEAAQTAGLNGDMAPFTAAVKRGVSANLCDAVVGLAEAGSGDQIDVQVSWSRARPVEGGGPKKMSFGRDRIPIIEEAARHIRESAPVEDFEVEGFVTRLDRGPDAREGDVTVEGVVDGHMRRIAMRLEPDAYSAAVRAHDNRLRVKCIGELTKAGRGHRLEHPRSFEIAQDDT